MVANTQNDVTVEDLAQTLLGHASIQEDRVKIRKTVAHLGDDKRWHITNYGNLPETFALSASAVTPAAVANEIARAKAEILDHMPDVK